MSVFYVLKKLAVCRSVSVRDIFHLTWEKPSKYLKASLHFRAKWGKTFLSNVFFCRNQTIFERKNKKSKEVFSEFFPTIMSDLPNGIASFFNQPMMLQKHYNECRLTVTN